MTKFNLQLFAEENTQTEKTSEQSSGTQTETAGKNTDKTKEPEQTQPKYTDKDLDRIISEKFAKWQKQSEQKVSEAKRLAEMNAQEKAEYEREQYKTKYEELEKKIAISEMQSTARDMLAEEGVNVADSVVSMLISTDAEQTQSAVKDFAQAFKKAVSDGVTEALKGKTPQTGTGAKITKEEILKIKDRAERQKAIRENIELFK